MIVVDWSDCSFDTTYVLFYQMNDILFIDFHLVVCDFFKLDWCEIISSIISQLTFASQKPKIETLEKGVKYV